MVLTSNSHNKFEYVFEKQDITAKVYCQQARSQVLPTRYFFFSSQFLGYPLFLIRGILRGY